MIIINTTNVKNMHLHRDSNHSKPKVLGSTPGWVPCFSHTLPVKLSRLESE